MSLRIGIVGCGAIHGTHAEAIQRIEQASIGGFYDVVHSRSAKAAETYGGFAYQSLDDLLSSVDAVAVCVPSGLHTEVGLKAVAAGKHVLVEKPIDVSFQIAMALVDGAREEGVTLSVISQHRFSPEIQRLKRTIDAGELGHLIEGDAYIKWYRTQAYYDSGDWRGTWKLDGGGCLINQGIHYVDMIQWLMGGVKSVRAIVRTAAHDIEVEDSANVLVEYRNGAMGVIQGSTSYYPGFAERLEVHGKLGSVVVEGDRIKAWEIDDQPSDGSPYGRGVQMQPTPSLQLASLPTEVIDDTARRNSWVEQHRLQILDFIEACLEGREPFITGEMALEPLKIVLAIYESARQDGRKIEVDSI
jgi:UDP-N-acetyl-2-amino-2-deoxyglucuronate dehydrogenase